jgi:hypothetical protein
MPRSRISFSGTSFSRISALILGPVLLVCSGTAAAQHHGGGGRMGGGGGISGMSRPTGVDDKDSLKDFHQVLALQGTSQQVAEFQRLVRNTEAAQAALQSFQQQLHPEKGTEPPGRQDALDQALENARTETKKFQESFSAAQKSGLKDLTKRLARADSDLDQGQKKLDQSLDAKAASPEVASLADGLGKALTDFYNQQLALGREMSITLASGQDLAFTLPRVKSAVSIGPRTIPVDVSGMLSQVAAQGGQRTFKLELVADLSDLQQHIGEILSAQLDTADTCGQRVSIRQAALTPATPASMLKVWLHFERWMCTRTLGQQTSNELAEGDGTVEIKLTATVENPNTLKLATAFGRIDATGMLAESLRSGSLGDDLRDQVGRSVLSAARAGSDFKVALPPAVQNSAVIESAKFQDVGVGGLSIVLEGHIEISNEQAEQLASQLNQALSAQGTHAPGTLPQLTKRPD